MNEKNQPVNLTELLAESEHLKAHIGSFKRFRRDATELDDAASALTKEDPRSGRSGRYDQNAFRLLASRGYDAEGLMRDISSHQVETEIDPTDRLEDTDIEGYLAHHHDMIVLMALEESKRAAADNMREVQRRWLMDDWLDAKNSFLEKLE